MSKPSDEEMQKSVEMSLPVCVIYIRIGPLGPLIMGGLVDEILNDRGILSEEGAALFTEAHHRAVEAILGVLANAPGASGPPVALKDERGVLDRYEKDQDLAFFDNVKVIDDDNT